MELESSVTKSKKPMNRDEVDLFIDLISKQPFIFSKQTNASMNKNKDESWDNVTTYFNSATGIYRSKEQLKSKWDNMKKAARKRSQQIRLNSLKTGGGKPDYIPQDETLEKVASLLGSTCTGFKVPFGGDGVGPSEDVVIYTDEIPSPSPMQSSDNPIEDTTPMSRKRCLEFGVMDENQNIPASSKLQINKDNTTTKRVLDYGTLLGDNGVVMPPTSMRKSKAKKMGVMQDNWSMERNKAIALYYDKKREKIELEIKLLKMELDKYNRENEES